MVLGASAMTKPVSMLFGGGANRRSVVISRPCRALSLNSLRVVSLLHVVLGVVSSCSCSSLVLCSSDCVAVSTCKVLISKPSPANPESVVNEIQVGSFRPSR